VEKSQYVFIKWDGAATREMGALRAVVDTGGAVYDADKKRVGYVVD